MDARQTEHQLKDYLSKNKYNYREQTKKDVLNAILNFKDLKPHVDTFVENSGKSKRLVCLDGTIPVNYRGSNYNIPICVWLQTNHPYTPPICYVKPTQSMSVKVSRHVDQSGLIYLPYLHEWKPPMSDLSGLIQVMCIVFGEQPPVYSQSRSVQPPPTVGYAMPREPAPHMGGPPLPGYGYPPQLQYGRSPAPYPMGGFRGMPMPGQGVPPGVGQTPYPPSSYPPASGPPSSSANLPYPSGSMGPRLPPQPPQPIPHHPHVPQHQQPRYLTPQTSHEPVSPVYPTGGQSLLETVTPVAAGITAAPQSPKDLDPELQAEMEKAKRMSVQSSIEYRLKLQMKEVFERAQSEMQSLQSTKDELAAGSRKLNEMLNTLDRKQEEVEESIRILTTKDEEIREALKKLETASDGLTIDETVVATTPLYKQILDLFAEENAIEDTIYYLTEGLRNGVLSVEVFLKHVRDLSRRQFMLRALMQKARKTAGLGKL